MLVLDEDSEAGEYGDVHADECRQARKDLGSQMNHSCHISSEMLTISRVSVQSLNDCSLFGYSAWIPLK